ncbi:DNA recombination protein RmuC [Usitatibacter palustris]|nr:DNA recombination protein RmuC [Usitatibacter palustris]
MDSQSLLVVLAVLVVILVAVVAWLAVTLRAGQESRHREVLSDLHSGLNTSADRIASRQSEEGDRLRRAVADELQRNREGLLSFEKALAEKVDHRLGEIGGKVSERLDEGFKRTNDTFVNVMLRLQTIDDAQKKLEALSSNVTSLQNLLGSKSARGALGERQLEDLVRNMLPDTAFDFQYTFPSGVRADCVLKLPEPMGLLCVDSKFPLENYERMISDGAEKVSITVFKSDVRRHVDNIALRYIIPGQTADGAVMFVPSEAIFAEIHSRHRDLVDYALQKRVWIVSPTTMMAVVNTARVVIKDVEQRRQIHLIKDELGKLAADFNRFQARMDKLATHINQAKTDVEDVQTSSRKITERFVKIERVELDSNKPSLTLVKPNAEGNDSE